ncbi:MAG: PLP-dependent aminotransferase family protein [Burkholderiaceae bacterium]|nr:PLP-dependent aminotransferase family protein [Burkholderiaceae bacterium]
MLIQSPWIPHLANTGANIAERLSLALASDIIEGRLAGGDRLPAHRDLAKTLQIGLGTVTKAYAILERRGLTRSVNGRGTFVAIHEAHSHRQIDLSTNAPPASLGARLLARTLTGIARKIDEDHFNLYAPPGGHFEHRRVLARWLHALGLDVDPSCLILTSGARQALALAFDLVCGRQGLILTERMTYPGAIALARRKGYRMQGVEMDSEGMVPQALAEALAGIKAQEKKAVYLTPTLHNPTTATMGVARRQSIAEICRQAGAWIIEDGVYAAASPELPQLATLAPDIALHVNGLSKSLGPGLQIGMLTLPHSLSDTAQDFLRELPMAPSALSCAVVDEWLVTGVIASIQQDLRHEAQRRSRLAASLLSTHGLIWHPDAYNAWLPMKRDAADSVASAAMEMGVKLTSPQSTMVRPSDSASGLRICLGGASWEDLNRSLAILATLLK